MLSTSPDGKYLLVADAGRNVSIYSHENDRWKLHCQLPKYDGAITAFAVQPKKSSLVVAYNDHKIIEYDIKEKAFTDFSKTISNHTIQFGEDKFKHPVRRILFDPHEVNKILLHVGSEIYVLNKDKVRTIAYNCVQFLWLQLQRLIIRAKMKFDLAPQNSITIQLKCTLINYYFETSEWPTGTLFGLSAVHSGRQ